jgi:hypothetical protein
LLESFQVKQPAEPQRGAAPARPANKECVFFLNRIVILQPVRATWAWRVRQQYSKLRGPFGISSLPSPHAVTNHSFFRSSVPGFFNTIGGEPSFTEPCPNGEVAPKPDVAVKRDQRQNLT